MRILRKRSKPDAAAYIFYGDSMVVDVRTAIVNDGWEIRTNLIWNKNMAQFGMLGAQYKMQHEPFLYCHLKGQSPRWFGPTNETTVWSHSRASVNEFHPTQKPIDLIGRAIRNSSQVNDLICDPCMGSGTTLRAAKDLGRRCIGIEIEEKYCKIAVERLRQEVLELS